jgi:hypothetical protein
VQQRRPEPPQTPNFNINININTNININDNDNDNTFSPATFISLDSANDCVPPSTWRSPRATTAWSSLCSRCPWLVWSEAYETSFEAKCSIETSALEADPGGG